MAVYLLCLDTPLAHARHYTGWAKNARTLERRIEHHANGTSHVRFMEAVREAGITFTLVQVEWDGTRDRERQLKQQGGATRRCPRCREAAKAARKAKRDAHRAMNPRLF